MIKPNIPAQKYYGFFSRMLLISTVLLTLVSVVSSIIVGNLSQQYEQTQYLKNYDLAMANLAEAFYERHASFNTLAGKLLTGNQCDPDLCILLKSSSYDEVPAGSRSNIRSLLSSISQDDRYLRGFLIYSPEQEQLYLFMDDRSYLTNAPALPDEMPQFIPYTGNRAGNLIVEQMMSACNIGADSSRNYYGLAATIYINPAEPLGYLIALYSTSEFDNILSNYQLDESSTFYISDEQGNTYYHSWPFGTEEGKIHYSSGLVNTQYKFQVNYEINSFNIPRNSITYMIITFAAIVTLFSFGLYYLTYYLSTKNINGILTGMKAFRVDNLAYRIPVPEGHHEFTQITQGFNDMCEKLQKSVERTYVYELQQKKSELYALQTSINPHFLYNTLEMIRGQVLNTQTQDASQMILLLSKIYRSQTNTNMFVTLEDEVDLCENLMILYQYRFQNFDYDFQIEEEVKHFALPKNTLQPLIENYFVHGIILERQDNLLMLSAVVEWRGDKPYVHLCLCNNGKPIGKSRLTDLTKLLNNDIYADQSDGFALTNIHNRLRIVFQEDCTMQVSSGSDDMNFQICITFPGIQTTALKESFL